MTKCLVYFVPVWGKAGQSLRHCADVARALGEDFCVRTDGDTEGETERVLGRMPCPEDIALHSRRLVRESRGVIVSLAAPVYQVGAVLEYARQEGVPVVGVHVPEEAAQDPWVRAHVVYLAPRLDSAAAYCQARWLDAHSLLRPSGQTR